MWRERRKGQERERKTQIYMRGRKERERERVEERERRWEGGRDGGHWQTLGQGRRKEGRVEEARRVVKRARWKEWY